MKKGQSILLSTVIVLSFSCCKSYQYDLAVKNVDVFDSEKGEVLKDRTILINADAIVSTIPASQKVHARNEIEGAGRLVVPGFVDTHIHLTDLFGDYENAPELLAADSLAVYRKRLSHTYLAHGITTLKVAGQPEKWIAPSLEWQNNPLPDSPDIYISGGAMISDEDRAPYISHVEVASPEAARRKVQAYYDQGIRHVKLYWRLRDPELEAAYNKATELNMNIAGHIDQNVASMDKTLALGLRHYEHVHTMAMSVFQYRQHLGDFMPQFDRHFKDQPNARFFTFMLEVFRYVDANPELADALNSQIDQLAAHGASLSTTIHLFAEKCGNTYFTIPPLSPEDDASGFNALQTNRCQENFKIMMSYVKKAHDRGVKLVLGTDSRQGGKAALSEMLLLKEAGFSVEDILKIATLNGAEAMGLEEKYGSITSGKKANLVIFSKSPFDDVQHFLAEKLIIKDGEVFRSSN